MGNDILGRNTGTVLAVSGIVASSIILTFVLEGDGRKIGLYLAFLAALALAYGGWRGMNEAPAPPGPLAGAGGLGGGQAPASSPRAPTSQMPAGEPGVPGGGAAGVSPGKEGPGAPHPGTSTGAPGDEGDAQTPAAPSGDP